MNLKQFSLKIGLSPTTVSRAMSGYPEVKQSTCERVLAAAKQYNYQPDTRAIRLATGRSMAIGHILPISTRHEIVNPIFADFIAGAGEVYSLNDYDMLLSVVRDEQEVQAYRKLKSKGNVDGVIIHSPKQNDERIALLSELGIPFVVHGRASGINLSYSWVDTNNLRAFQRAATFLIELGHRRVALINGLEQLDFAQRRREGYCNALQNFGLSASPELMFSGQMSETHGHEAASDMLALPAPPTAFLVSSMMLGMGVRRAAQERGLTLGRDISVVIHDDDLSYMKNTGTVPMFTATRSSIYQAGRYAAEMLLQLIAEPGQPHQQRLLEAELIIGQSTGPA